MNISGKPNNRVINLLYYLFLFGVITLFFHTKFDIRALNIHEINWVYNSGGDFLADFTYWRYYQYSSVSGPLGTFAGYSGQIVGVGNTIAFLPAWIFRRIHQLHPLGFVQYFGWFLYISYLLHAYFTDRCFRLLGVTVHWKRMLMVLLVAVSHPLIMRYFHNALCAHWIISAAIFMYLRPVSWQRNVAGYALLSFLAAIIHPYLVLFPLAMALADSLHRYGGKKIPLYALAVTNAASVISVLLGGYVSGIFTLPASQSVAEGMGYFSSNWNTFFNNMGNASFSLLNLPNCLDGQYEGAAYMGAGILLLFCILVFSPKKLFRHTSAVIRENKALTIIAAFFFLYACAFQFTFSKAVCWTIDYSDPNWLQEKLAVFRSSGRYVWLPFYLLMIWLLLQLYRSYKPVTQSVILVIIFAVQFWDFKPVMDACYNYNTYTPHPSEKMLVALANASDSVYVYPPFGKRIAHPDDAERLTIFTAPASKYITAGFLPRPNNDVIHHLDDVYKKIMSTGEWALGQQSILMVPLADIYLFDKLKSSKQVPYYCYDEYAFFIPESNVKATAICRAQHFGEKNMGIISITDYLVRQQGKTIIITALDDASAALPESLKNYTHNRMHSVLGTLGFRQTYIGVWSQDSVVYEHIQDKDQEYTYVLGKQDTVFIRSVTNSSTNHAVIMHNGTRLPECGRGLNIAVFDADKKLLEVKNFDTYLSAFANDTVKTN